MTYWSHVVRYIIKRREMVLKEAKSENLSIIFSMSKSMDLTFSSSASEVLKKEFQKSGKYQKGKFEEDIIKVDPTNLTCKKKSYEARKHFTSLSRNTLQPLSISVRIPYNQVSHSDLNRSFTIPQRSARSLLLRNGKENPYWSSRRGK